MNERLLGRVKFFATQKGFGFITAETGEDLFFHQNECGGIVLGSGDMVEYSIGQARRGPCAVQIVRLEASTALLGIGQEDENHEL